MRLSISDQAIVETASVDEGDCCVLSCRSCVHRRHSRSSCKCLSILSLCLQVPSSMHSGAGDDDDVMRLMAKYNQLQALLDDLIVKVRVN